MQYHGFTLFVHKCVFHCQSSLYCCLCFLVFPTKTLVLSILVFAGLQFQEQYTMVSIGFTHSTLSCSEQSSNDTTSAEKLKFPCVEAIFDKILRFPLATHNKRNVSQLFAVAPLPCHLWQFLPHQIMLCTFESSDFCISLCTKITKLRRQTAHLFVDHVVLLKSAFSQLPMDKFVYCTLISN